MDANSTASRAPPHVDVLGQLAVGTEVRDLSAVVHAGDLPRERPVFGARQPHVDCRGVPLDDVHSTPVGLTQRLQGDAGVVEKLRPHDGMDARRGVRPENLPTRRPGEHGRVSREENDVVGGHRVARLAPRARALSRRTMGTARPRLATAEPERLAEIRAALASEAIVDAGARALFFRIGIACRRRGSRDARSNGRAAVRGGARESRAPAIDPNLVPVDASNGNGSLAAFAGAGAGGAPGGAGGYPTGGRGACQSESRAVEARELALLAPEDVRSRGGAARRVSLLEVPGAWAEGAGRLPVDHEALFAPSRAVSHGQHLSVPAGQRSALDIA